MGSACGAASAMIESRTTWPVTALSPGKMRWQGKPSVPVFTTSLPVVASVEFKQENGTLPQISVEMFEPGRDGYNMLVPLPSGREWIGVGGRGEWDHYGEPDLVPVKPKKPAKPTTKKAKPA